ncbi:bifunctional nuclease family protein [Candidatus Aerophobetes bacterium]|nr:bifunctional nuclease family protein [Candidatus Aerophobetes bacterium]
MLEVNIINVGMDVELNTPVVILEGKERNKKLPIWMNLREAKKIASIWKSKNSSLLYDLIESLVKKFIKGKVKKVIINDLEGNIYHAKVLTEKNNEIIEIDARPSDAIALALALRIPIYIDEVKLSIADGLISDEEIEEFRKKLEHIKPEDFIL